MATTAAWGTARSPILEPKWWHPATRRAIRSFSSRRRVRNTGAYSSSEKSQLPYPPRLIRIRRRPSWPWRSPALPMTCERPKPTRLWPGSRKGLVTRVAGGEGRLAEASRTSTNTEPARPPLCRRARSTKPSTTPMRRSPEAASTTRLVAAAATPMSAGTPGSHPDRARLQSSVPFQLKRADAEKGWVAKTPTRSSQTRWTIPTSRSGRFRPRTTRLLPARAQRKRTSLERLDQPIDQAPPSHGVIGKAKGTARVGRGRTVGPTGGGPAFRVG